MICQSCGGTHIRSQCRFRNARCRACQKVGHLAKVCRSKANRQRKKNFKRTANSLASVDNLASRFPDSLILNNLRSSPKRDQSCVLSRKIRVTVIIKSFPCEMEIYTGSEFTILSEYVFRKLSQGRKIRLEPITLKLATFQGELVKVKGSCSVNVQYGNIHRTLTLIVAKGHCPNLLGLNWFEPLGIHLSGVHHLTSIHPQISEVLRKYRSECCHTLTTSSLQRVMRKLAGRLETVLHRFSKAGLRLKSDKCKFCLPRVEFLGFEIDATGIHPAKAKVETIQDAPTPKNKQQLQAFLGLLNFYHSFLKDKATVAEPLHRLLDKNARWTWTGKHEKAFRDVKRLLSSDAVLTHYDSKKPLVLLCDASPHGIGAVLCHKLSSTQEIPIAFYSRTLSTTERNYAQIDKEALAVIAGVKKFHEYLYGRQFTIITDHKPLLGLFAPKKETPQILSPRMLRWSTLLNAYNYAINYRPGKEIANADALKTIDNSPLHGKDIARITAKHPILTRVLSWAWKGWPKSVSDERLKPYVTRQHEISIHNGCLQWGSRVIIPLQARHKILKELHVGHPGIVRMKALARSYVWWPKLDSEIEKLVRTCELCQQSRASPPHAPAPKWESPRIPWSRIHVDLAGPICGENFLLLIREDLFNSLSPKPEIQPVYVHLLSASGDPLDVLGTCRLPIRFVAQSFAHTLFVARNFAFPGLLGADFLLSNGCVINLDDNVLRIGSTEVHL
ncbi:Transposon Tf2-8 polyprotein [Trichinella zimbabwensis]|uniref:RNA-directed DNA polymerase n=1 Tax=Trichinella zimbabwensis TaxID=268475 RepID=A0A0V1HUV9_9BILA|nr:Transposon Tf2-8 polyprotein [Trichinella zimbabwensis]